VKINAEEFIDLWNIFVGSKTEMWVPLLSYLRLYSFHENPHTLNLTKPSCQYLLVVERGQTKRVTISGTSLWCTSSFFSHA